MRAAPQAHTLWQTTGRPCRKDTQPETTAQATATVAESIWHGSTSNGLQTRGCQCALLQLTGWGKPCPAPVIHVGVPMDRAYEPHRHKGAVRQVSRDEAYIVAVARDVHNQEALDTIQKWSDLSTTPWNQSTHGQNASCQTGQIEDYMPCLKGPDSDDPAMLDATQPVQATECGWDPNRHMN